MTKVLNFIFSLFVNVLFVPRNIGIFVLILYRKFVSPMYGNVCKYYPSCSFYALMCIQKFGFIVAGFLIFYRIVRCNPFSKGGFDYPPIKKSFHKKIVISKFGFVYFAVK